MPRFELYVPRAHRSPRRRGVDPARAFTVALVVFGTAFVATLVLEPAPLAPQASPARATAAAAPCLPAKLVRHGDLVAGRPSVRRLRVPDQGPQNLVDAPDGRLVKIDNPAVEAPPGEAALAPATAAEPESLPSAPPSAQSHLADEGHPEPVGPAEAMVAQ